VDFSVRGVKDQAFAENVRVMGDRRDWRGRFDKDPRTVAKEHPSHAGNLLYFETALRQIYNVRPCVRGM